MWLITQRSRVQIPAPLPSPETLSRTERGPLLVVCKLICKRGSRSDRLTGVPADRRAPVLVRLVRDHGGGQGPADNQFRSSGRIRAQTSQIPKLIGAGSIPVPARLGYRQNCRSHTDRTVAVAVFDYVLGV